MDPGSFLRKMRSRSRIEKDKHHPRKAELAKVSVPRPVRSDGEGQFIWCGLHANRSSHFFGMVLFTSGFSATLFEWASCSLIDGSGMKRAAVNLFSGTSIRPVGSGPARTMMK